MTVTFLGTSHGITEKYTFCSSAAVTVGGKHYLVDAGAPLDTLLQNYDLSFWDVRGLFITHPHQDHYSGLCQLVFTMEDYARFEGVSIPVYMPEGIRIDALNVFLFGDPKGVPRYREENPPEYRVRFHTYPDADPAGSVIFDDGTLRVTAYPVRHCPHSHALLLEAEGKRLLFTGDLSRDLSEYPALVSCADRLDLVVTEAAHSRLSEPAVADLYRETNTPRLVISHRNPDRNPLSAVEELAAALAPKINVVAAYDGMILNV